MTSPRQKKKKLFFMKLQDAKNAALEAVNSVVEVVVEKVEQLETVKEEAVSIIKPETASKKTKPVKIVEQKLEEVKPDLSE
jgi:hypothetical protein